MNGAPDLGRLDTLEFKHRAPAQNGAIYIEIRIFRGRGNHCDAAVLQKLKQRLLLLFVEILDLVQIQKNTVYSVDPIQAANDLADVRRGSGRAVELAELPLCLPGNEGGKCRFPHTGRTVKNHIRDHAGFNDAPERTAGREQMALPHNIVERLRADAVRQR